MSTNYYVRTPDGAEIHLGKASVGWPFIFRGYPEQGVVDYASWRALLDRGTVVNEYGTTLTADELERIVADHRLNWGRSRPAIPGPDQVDDANGNRFSCYEFC